MTALAPNGSLLNMQSFFKTIPNTRYYGSKKRLLPWIYETLKTYEYETVLDLFGGTASVSLLFQKMGKQVTYNDAMLSNGICANVLLNGKVNKEISKRVDTFFSNIQPNYGKISKNYAGIFFTGEENQWLDGAMEKIHSMPQSIEKDLYLYLVMQASLMKRPFNLFHRANLNLRTNKNIHRSFGNLTTWERSFVDTIKILVAELEKLESGHIPAIIHHPTTAEKISNGYDLVYIDPPYVQRSKKDTYWKKYHFLEGMANYPKMESMIERKLKINQLKSNQDMENWEEPSLFKDKLFSLIDKHKKSIVVLSYMTNAIPSEDELVDCFSSTFAKVKISYHDLSHAMSKGKKTEILLIGAP